VTRLLVDTHALLWWLDDDAALSPAARAAIANPGNSPLVSAASVWEMAIKCSLGKLRLPDDVPAKILDAGFEWLAVSAAHTWDVRRLPLHHRDPFDRLIVAQALRERIGVVTRDRRFDAYGVDTLW
jgi:PIN domain nuclease of toxin-antitoxin system